MSDKWRCSAMTAKTNVNTTTDGNNKHANTHTHTHTFARIISTYLHIKDNCCTNTLGRGYKESLQSQQVHTQRQRRMKGALVYNNNKHNRDAWLYFYNYHLRYSGIFFDFTIPAGSFRALKLLFRMNIHFQFCYYFDRSTFYV